MIRTLRGWSIRIDEALFLGGMDKGEFLKAFGAGIFFRRPEGPLRIRPPARGNRACAVRGGQWSGCVTYREGCMMGAPMTMTPRLTEVTWALPEESADLSRSRFLGCILGGAVGDALGHAKALLTCIQAATARNDLDDAARCARESLEIARRHGFDAIVSMAQCEADEVIGN